MLFSNQAGGQNIRHKSSNNKKTVLYKVPMTKHLGIYSRTVYSLVISRTNFSVGKACNVTNQ